MSIQSNKLMNLADGKVLYDDLRQRIEQGGGAAIDDTAGAGDTDKAWSADKLTEEFAEMEDLVVVQDATPTENVTKVWLPATPPQSVQVPTYGEFSNLLNQINVLDNSKAPIIIDNASGAIATFPDGADDLPVESLVAEINPVQDLHGQSAPYPAGGGKNKCHIDDFSSTTVSGLQISSTSNVLSVAGTSSTVISAADNIWKNIKFHVAEAGVHATTFTSALPSGCSYGYYDSNGTYVNAGASLSVGDYTVGIYVPSGAVFGNYTTQIQTEKGSATSYAPYENICPITGWTECNVTRTGKNLFDNVWEIGLISNTTGENVSGNTHVRCKNYIPCKNGQTIYVGWDTTETGSVYMLVMAYKADGSFSRYIGARTYPFPVQLNDDEHFIRFYLYNRTEPLVNPYIVYGSTATSYAPYQGSTYPITWEEAGTVYGGTVNPVTGKLIVTDAEIESYNGETLPSTWISDRDVYAEGTTPTIGAQVVYKLAEPLEYDLTPIEIRTLLGYNALFADTGDVEVDYRADTKLYIDNKITQAIAAALNS